MNRGRRRPSDLAILRIILFRLADTGDKGDRKDAQAVKAHLYVVESAVKRGSSAAVLDGARRLQAILSERIRTQED